MKDERKHSRCPYPSLFSLCTDFSWVFREIFIGPFSRHHYDFHYHNQFIYPHSYLIAKKADKNKVCSFSMYVMTDNTTTTATNADER